MSPDRVAEELDRGINNGEIDCSFNLPSNTVSSSQGIDYNHHLFLTPTDVSGVSLISFQLLGIENYTLWSRSITLALLGRNKIGLVDGSCRKEVYVSKSLLSGVAFASSALQVWNDLKKRFDRVDGSRTYSLHKDIATLQQCTNSVSEYYTRLKTLWDESELLVPAPCCNCDKSKGFVAHMNRQKLYQFLMELNESYQQARSHSKKYCYKIIGYPPDFKSKRKPQGIASDGNPDQVHFSYGMNTNVQVLGWGRKPDSPQSDHGVPGPSSSSKLVSQAELEHKTDIASLDCNATPAAAHTAGKSLHVLGINRVWIVDTGATNHMVSDLDMFIKGTVSKLEVPKVVYLPNGDSTQVTHEAHLYSGKVKQIGEETGCLYTQKHVSNQRDIALNVSQVSTDMELWHQRLGHVSSGVLVRIGVMFREDMFPFSYDKNSGRHQLFTDILQGGSDVNFQKLSQPAYVSYNPEHEGHVLGLASQELEQLGD
ncbi:uncharacterized protein LOC125851670 [Solanum stenotomum]|uniref:uncharacterized protein LOC125851670 n=1 Tax=Solanum stenotomum TaxID=172797 RepID=UPI0020CFF965|nr:uncharacterized protein LOC125851670 [Solanum stenotomum]